MSADRRQCFANHLAAQWAIEPAWAERMLAQIKAVGLPPMQSMRKEGGEAADPMAGVREYRGGVAIITIDGPMAKFDSSMGGSNTVRVRAALRSAAADDGIGAIVLRADSPGGTVDGTMELAAEVNAADAIKPVFGYAEDMAASAAYWVLAQSRKLYANAAALVGSIGVFTILVDSSKAFEVAGLKAVLVGTGAMKGLGAEGLPITDDQVAYVQDLINDRSKFFIDAVAAGRELATADVKALADGRVFVAAKAKQLGLIDAVKTFDEVLAEATERGAKVAGRAGRRMAAEIDIESARG